MKHLSFEAQLALARGIVKEERGEGRNVRCITSLLLVDDRFPATCGAGEA